MAKYSANLGFLWTELSLPEAIEKSAQAGFDAVECHWPYDYPATQIVESLQQHQLPMLGLNTLRGDSNLGEFGLSAVPGREQDARGHIEQAVSYAADSGTQNVHVMAGVCAGNPADSRTVFIDNLRYAAELARPHNIHLLIEPINHRDIPGYFLNTIEQAAELIDIIGDDSIRIMFDCYHTQITQGDLITRLGKHLELIGHIQIASNPKRQEPDSGEVDYRQVIDAIDAMGYSGYIGAEYKPAGSTEAGIGWLAEFKDN